MAANVKIIPPREKESSILRVAAYCRVSTDHAEQALSYASQIRNYTDLINGHEGWELVDVYADEAVSGTKTDKREDFNRMLSDCRKGRIDKVLVKSLSRFSRNTKDCLAALRELMSLGVTVQFEKENIDTETLTTEFLVSVFGALAQQESVSISENGRQGFRRRMELGQFITTKPPYGYSLKGSGCLEIIPEEAELVRWVFDAYLSGHSVGWIVNDLISRGVLDRKGNVHWTTRQIYYWLSNEKYIGDTLCQKTYKTGFPFTQKINHGEVDQIYVEGSHPAIISRETFEKVQALRQRKKKRRDRPDGVYPLSRKMYCETCGEALYRRTTRKGTAAWSCRNHLRNAAFCSVGPIPEEAIHAAFARMYNKLRLHDGVILKPALGQLDALNEARQRNNPAMLAVNRAIAEASDQSYMVTTLQSKGVLDASAGAAKLRELDGRLAELRKDRRRLLKEDDLEEALDAFRQTVNKIHSGPDRLEDFDETLFADLVEKVTAESRSHVRFHLRGGIELAERVQEEET
nr:recombinase family protein [uncultured Oscillibacter sp.]